MTCRQDNNWGQRTYEYLPTEHALFKRHNDDCNAHGGWIRWAKDILQGRIEYAKLRRPFIFDPTQDTGIRVATETWPYQLDARGYGDVQRGITLKLTRANEADPSEDRLFRLHAPGGKTAHLVVDGTITSTEAYLQVFGNKSVTAYHWHIGLRSKGPHRLLYNVDTDGNDLVGIGLHSENNKIYFVFASNEDSTPNYPFYLSPVEARFSFSDQRWYPLALSGESPNPNNPDSIGFAIFPEGNENRRVEFSSRKNGGFRIYQASAGMNTIYSDEPGNIYVAKDLYVYGEIYVSSDIRIKTNIKPFDKSALEIIKNARVYSFIKNGVPSLGLIAQELENLEHRTIRSAKGFRVVDLYAVVGILWKAIQELLQVCKCSEGGKDA